MADAGTLVHFRVEGDTVFFLDGNRGKHRADTPAEVMRALRAIQDATGEASTGQVDPPDSWLETIAQQCQETIGDAYGPLAGRVSATVTRNGPAIISKIRGKRTVRRRS